MTNPCWSLATNFENHKIISATKSEIGVVDIVSWGVTMLSHKYVIICHAAHGNRSMKNNTVVSRRRHVILFLAGAGLFRGGRVLKKAYANIRKSVFISKGATVPSRSGTKGWALFFLTDTDLKCQI